MRHRFGLQTKGFVTKQASSGDQDVNIGSRTDRSVEALRMRVSADIGLQPFGFVVRRDGRRVLGPVSVRAWCGSADDQFVGLTEGVVAMEELGDPVDAVALQDGELVFADGSRGRFDLSIAGSDHLIAVVEAPEHFHRVALVAPGHPEQRFSGLGARHGLHVDQAGRGLQLGADRRYTGPDCPPDMLELGGIPQGDYAPVPWLLGSRGWAAWVETDGHGARFELGDELQLSIRRAAGPLRVHLLCAGTPAARLRAFLRLTGLPAVLPEWAYGHWKSRDVYEHQRDVEEDFDGYAEHALALDAIVLDSP
jgi:alpha-D-xyloside xylohydrolase